MTKSKSRFLFTDVGSDPYVGFCAAMLLSAMQQPENKDLRVSVIVHITNLNGVSPQELELFNKAQVRFGSLENLTQMRDKVYTKENIYQYFTIS